MAIMDLFTSLQTIINERSAKKVRQSIHDGIFRANQVVDANKNLVDQVAIRQDAVEQYNDQMIAEMTDKDVISAPELIDMRKGYAKAGDRINAIDRRIDDTALNVKNYGVVGDGITDDTSAMLLAKNDAIDRKLPLFIPKDINAFLPTKFSFVGITKLIVDGKVTTPELEVGYYSNNGVSVNIDINSVSDTLKVIGLANGNIKLRRAKKLKLFADGSIPAQEFIAYSRFELGFVDELEINSIGISPGGVGGWINENTFIGGNFKKILIDGTYSHNNNIFYKPSIENSKIEIIRGSDNFFHDVRLEGVNNIFFGENATNNKIYTTYVGGNITMVPRNVTYTDHGWNNAVINSNFKDLKHETFVISAGSNNHNLVALMPTQDSIQVMQDYGHIIDSGLVLFTNNLALDLKSDKPLFRLVVMLYDLNGNLVRKDDSFRSNNLNWYSGDNFYQSGINSRSIVAEIKQTEDIKYIRVRVIFGNNVVSQNFDSLSLSVISDNLTQLSEIKTKISKNLINKKLSKPTHTENVAYGNVVYNSSQLASAGHIGWVYTTSGWKGFGAIEP